MGDETDEAIWHRVTGGDARAYGLIWDRHRDRVFRYLIARGNAATDAEDLTALVFLELWRRRTAVRFVDGSLLPWLVVTAQNVTRNAQRAQRRHRAFLEKLPRPESEHDPTARDIEHDDPRLVRLRAVLDAARPADARLLAMTALEGFTVREAASALGLTESAAKMRLSRLRARLSSGTQTLPEGGAS